MSVAGPCGVRRSPGFPIIGKKGTRSFQ
jgi:hypothetical protein